MREEAAEQCVSFVDAFTETEKWYSSGGKTWTIDGFQLTEEGYERFGEFLADEIFGRSRARAEKHRDLIHAAVNDKNWRSEERRVGKEWSSRCVMDECEARYH